MLGGEGGIIGTVFGGILLTVIINIMNLLGTSSLAQPMVVGIVILAMVLMDTFTQVRGEKFKKKPWPRHSKWIQGGKYEFQRTD